MSTVFRNALETHIDQLKHRINGANPAQIAEELRMTRELYGRTNDGRVKRSLGNSIRRLEAASSDAGHTEALRKILTHAQNLLVAIKDRPEYNKTRTKSPARSAARKNSRKS
ncbi:MAG TPA: hypothetical protein VFN22_05950 [Gemmatimonadales bacterium]|nr:hypothetical protein [Gemmatimonadales bacterium]